MAFKTVYFLLIVFFVNVYALFEDEVGTSDWYHQGIGHVKFAAFHPKQHAQAKRVVYVGTESSVVAALNTLTGDIVWRQTLPEGESLDLLAHEKRIVVTLSERGQIIRCWYANDGSLLWDSSTYQTNATHLSTSLQFEDLQQKKLSQLKESQRGKRDTPLSSYDVAFLPNDRPNSDTTGTIQYDRKDVDEKADPLVAVLYDNTVTVYEAASGVDVWSWSGHSNSNIKRFRLITIQNTLYVIGTHKNDELVINALDVKTGAVTAEKILKIPASITSSEKLIVLPSGWIVLYAKSSSSILLYSLTSDVSAFTTYSVSGLSVDDAKLQPLGSTIYLLNTRQNRYAFSIDDPTTPILTVEGKKWIYGFEDKSLGKFLAIVHVQQTTKTAQTTVSIKLNTIKNGQLTPLNDIAKVDFNEHGLPAYGFLNVYRGQANDQNPSYRLLLSATDHSLTLFQKGGVYWSKEEALASIQSVEFASLPHSEDFTEQPSFPPLHERLGLIATSIRHGIHSLKAFINNLQGGAPIKEDPTERVSDDFGFRRPIIAITSPGKIFALDSLNGEVLWQRQITEQDEDKQELIWRVHLVQHYTALVISHKIFNGEITSILRQINVITGEIIEIKKPNTFDLDPTTSANVIHLNFQIKEVITLPLKDSHGTQLLLFVDTTLRVWVFPGSNEAIDLFRPHLRHVFFYQTLIETSQLEGYGIYEFQQKGVKSPQVVFRCRSLWKISLPDNEKISALALNKEEVIYSAVRPIGSEQITLLHKYLNPNLIAVATVRGVNSGNRLIPAVKATTDPSVNIYLIDTVTGHILHKLFHKDCQGPVHIVKSENCVYYHYWDVKSQQYQLSVLELYQDQEENTEISSVFSSFNTTTPTIQQQTYILRTGVRVTEVTNTGRGITEKELLLGLNSGQILSLPKRFVDPRRPTQPPTQADMAEGLVPYDRELPCDPMGIISYNQTISNIRGIVTAPAGLESTSLVFTWGLDLFFTRVTPSGTFDLLSPDFSYLLLIATVTLCAFGQVIASYMSKTKQLQLDWA